VLGTGTQLGMAERLLAIGEEASVPLRVLRSSNRVM
jgi:hypothetical protein